MRRTPLQEQVDSLPRLVSEMIGPLAAAVGKALPDSLCENLRRVFVTGCGDNHHAALNSELAFEQLAGLPCEPMTAMQFGRYAARFLPQGEPGANLLLAISVSGQVSRTAEALALGRRAGGVAVAITGNPAGALAQEAEVVLQTAVPSLPTAQPGLVVPGARSYIASQLALYLTAIHLGEKRGHLSRKEAEAERRGLGETAVFQAQTIARCDPIAQQLAYDWRDANQFVYCGAGPNYGAALFSAAKFIEASGDAAIGQDTEEWAHLQYFGKQPDTPTFIISAGGWDASRAAEVVTAAQQIGRRVALIAPESSDLAQTVEPAALLPISGTTPEHCSPLLTCLPGLLFAAHRAELLNEPYFRAFSGGRSIQGGGGISRIQTSERIG
jgi:glutamine---fructose-6-phosphate transaminase (isomerizing)